MQATHDPALRKFPPGDAPGCAPVFDGQVPRKGPLVACFFMGHQCIEGKGLAEGFQDVPRRADTDQQGDVEIAAKALQAFARKAPLPP